MAGESRNPCIWDSQRTAAGFRDILMQDGSKVSVGKQIGEGASAKVYCFEIDCSKVIKIFKLGSNGRVSDEIRGAGILLENGIQHPKTISGGKNYVVKEFIRGNTLEEILLARESLSLEELRALMVLVERFRKKKISIDFSASNFVLQRSGGPLWIPIDLESIRYDSKEYSLNSWATELFIESDVEKRKFLSLDTE